MPSCYGRIVAVMGGVCLSALSSLLEVELKPPTDTKHTVV